MIQININSDLCVGCDLCVHLCPEMVLYLTGGYLATVINLEQCNLCMVCEEECPEGAIEVRET